MNSSRMMSGGEFKSKRDLQTSKSNEFKDKGLHSSGLISEVAFKDEKIENESPVSSPEGLNQESILNSSTLSEDMQYVTDNNEQTITFVYPRSALPLLSSNTRGIVNLVELPHDEDADDSLELDSSLQFQGSVVLQNGFSSGNQIAIMTTDGSERELRFVEAHDIGADHEEPVNYLRSTDVVALSRTSHENENSVLSEQLITIPTSEVVTNGNSITLPVSFVSDTGEVSLLHSLNHLPLTIGEGHSEGSFSIPVSIHSEYNIVPDGGSSDNSEYLIPELTSNVIAEKDESSQMLSQQYSGNTTDNCKNNVVLLKSPQSTVKQLTVHSGHPPKTQKKNKIIGSGPTAISAQGIIQEIGNRLVTVLPRPEDLRKLMDNKQLLLPVRGIRGRGKIRKPPVPVIPKSQYRQKRQSHRGGRTPQVQKLNFPGDNYTSKVLVDIREETDALDEDFTPQTLYRRQRARRRKRGRSKWKNKDKGTIVNSSSGRRPGRPRKVKTLIEGPNGPKLLQTGPSFSVKKEKIDEPAFEEADTSGYKKELPRQLSDGVTGCEVDYRTLNGPSSSTTTTTMANNADHVTEDLSETSKRKLPPRNRGAKYRKLIEVLKKTEYEDDDFDVSSDEDGTYTSQLSMRKTLVAPKPKNTSGPGKRGRPRKDVALLSSSWLDNGGTKIIKLSENLKPIESTSSSTVLIGDENSSSGDLNNLKHKLVITFEQPDTGEMVMQQISVQPSENKAEEIIESRIMMDPDTNITLVPSLNQGTSEYETATIFIREDGKFEEGYECMTCGDTTQFKRDHIRHLRQKHNLRPYDCSHCKRTFITKSGLLDHSLTHDLEKPHHCSHCGKGFSESSLLKSHLSEHSSASAYDCDHCGRKFGSINQFQQHISNEEFMELLKCQNCGQVFSSRDQLVQHDSCVNDGKFFVCDICQLKFVSSSGLNRHRKVHDRSNNNETNKECYKCSVCYATFSFDSSLSKHIQTVHEGIWQTNSSVKDEEQEQENIVIEQLRDKLNEGYAPKTAELYDVPKEDETMEMSSKDPFLCGICDDPFRDIDQLCDHYATCHMGDQSLYCSICSVGCSLSYQLDKHKLIHTREVERVQTSYLDGFEFICSLCGKRFRTASELEKHYRMHGQEKQYKCNFCNMSFSIKSALDKHILVHTGQRPFLCDICLKSFRQSAALVRHKLWTHRLKNKNKCGLCGKTFFTENLLLCHLEVHGEEATPVKEQLLKKKKVNKIEDVTSCQGAENVDQIKAKTEEKAKVCEYCGKECSSIVALLTHKITHKHLASYKCDQCHRTFREKRYLKKHKLTHKGLKTWKCDICSKTFATKLTLIRHSHVHLREALRPDTSFTVKAEKGEAAVLTACSSLPTILKCDECNISFSHKTHYVRHKLLHSGIPLLKCGLCDKMFVHKSDIIRHKVMHSFMFTCNICGRNFHKRSLYVMHIKRHSDAKPFKCDKCGKSFATSGNFKIHERIHSGEKPYHCNICDYKCSQSGRLLKHKRMHTGEKTSSCDVCGKSFANSESAKSHQRIHTGERPYKCSSCQKTFINSASLNQHMRDHWKEQLYKCDDCPHKFRRSDHLEKHISFHKLQKHYQQSRALGLDGDANIDNPLYMCDICGRVFDRKKYLYTHHNVHSRQKIFSCSICHKQLASRLALKNHLMIHSGEMPHKCHLCDKEFRNLSNLKRHEKVHCTQEMLNCEECGETFYSVSLLKEHKQAHVNLMMINSQVDAVDSEVSQQLYVFTDDGITDAMDNTQQLLVSSSQQQFLVDNSQSLLVFPGSGNETYDIAPPQTASDQELSPPPPPSSASSVQPSMSSTVGTHSHEEENLSDMPLPSDKVTVTSLRSEEADDDDEEEEEGRDIDKPHQCDVCLKSFAKKQYLTKHKYRHREVKPHSCEVCGKRFAQRFEVAVHKIRHTGEKPYQCDICQKDFRSKVNLNNHKMRHTGEYPYLCSVCNKGLSTQLQLERHVSLHTGAHPYRCEICGKGFFHQTVLLRHLTKSHNIQAVNCFEAIQPIENSETAEQMEVMEAISTISDAPHLLNDKQSMIGLINSTKKKLLVKDDSVLDMEAMEISVAGIDGELSDGHYEEGHPEYLKTCLMDSQHQDMGSKFLTSIFQQVRVEDVSSVSDDDNG